MNTCTISPKDEDLLHRWNEYWMSVGEGATVDHIYAVIDGHILVGPEDPSKNLFVIPPNWSVNRGDGVGNHSVFHCFGWFTAGDSPQPILDHFAKLVQLLRP